MDGGDAEGLLDGLVVFFMNASQVSGDLESEFFVSRHVDRGGAAPAHVPQGPPYNLPSAAFAGSRRKVLSRGRSPWLIIHGDQVLLRLDRLQQRAVVVVEDLSHLTGRQPGLHQIVAFGTARPRVVL